MLSTLTLLLVALATPTLGLPQFVAELLGRQEVGNLTGGSVWAWRYPGPGDARGPCPGLNTLANHGYLPRNGLNIDLQTLTNAMKEGFNINSGDAQLLFGQAIRTNVDYPNATTFDLHTLGREGVLEHDISLSRQDRYFGDPLPFNATIWHESLAYLKGDLITVDTLAQARMGRLNNSLAINPDFALSNLANAFSWGECASFFEILADGTTGTVEKRFIDYWLRYQRLPVAIGWKQRTIEMQGSEREHYSALLAQTGQLYAPPGVNTSFGVTGPAAITDGKFRFIH